MDLIHAIVLAAGKGTRMKSERAKVLHPLCGRPLIGHVLRTLSELSLASRTVVVGHDREAVERYARDVDATALFAFQAEQRGTGDAVRAALDRVPSQNGTALILNGDTPRLSAGLLRHFMQTHVETEATLTLMTAQLSNPTGYGRVIRRADGRVERIVEEKDATESEKRVEETNAGVYLASLSFLRSAIAELRPTNAQGEYYLTDIVAVALCRRLRVHAHRVADPSETLGINTRAELCALESDLYGAIRTRHLLNGVSMTAPETIFIDDTVTIGKETEIGPFTRLQGKTQIGETCRIEGHSVLIDTSVEGEAAVHSFCHLQGVRVGRAASVGPFARLRPGTALDAHVKIGNFVEIKNSHFSDGAKANHLSYVGDAEVGEDANIGAGTITCNYDGFRKSKTIIEKGVFIGSNTALVAPVRIAEGAIVGAGSIITKDVASNALALTRAEERHIEDGAARFRGRRKAEIGK